MYIDQLIQMYQHERNQSPNSMNDILDYYQKKYVTGEIDIVMYREIYSFLKIQGASSAHEYMYNTPKKPFPTSFY
ncbi:MAG: YppF family protein [Bacillota bacterium]|uniref:YppF-like protein n=1 Tax=Virgibacillus salarius TaxID=447199 RepID=A0A941DWU0_9BACI|nr:MULTISPECIES: YppF family protein [Bacillaceae]NAZ10968.1 hypothetical protein [Agaribacter marinus]MBR7798260.1 hypothetical protein [Virgibacillus salarius]MCC2251654.1 YppF family protein [Virgibacillus sp. AGTR]MDY7045398.1 YppF family protein [Virgibacillus sp. M23]QRZ16510.1 hypothetical protein JUJ52_11840 [Virgibacillus sp. AGTR]